MDDDIVGDRGGLDNATWHAIARPAWISWDNTSFLLPTYIHTRRRTVIDRQRFAASVIETRHRPDGCHVPNVFYSQTRRSIIKSARFCRQLSNLLYKLTPPFTTVIFFYVISAVDVKQRLTFTVHKSE